MMSIRPRGGQACRARSRFRNTTTGRSVMMLVALAAAVVGLAACGSSSKSSSSSSSSASSSAANTSSSASGGSSVAAGVARAAAVVAVHRGIIKSIPPPGPPIDAKPLRGKAIWYIPIGASIPALAQDSNAIQEATAGLGMSYKTCDGKLNPSDWSACITQAVNAGAAGIIVDSVDPTTVSTAVATAKSHKVPLLFLNEQDGAVDTHTPLLQAMSVGDVEDQPVMMDWIIANSKGKAHIMTSTVTGDKTSTAEVTGSLAEMHKNCPDCVQYNITSTPETVTGLSSSASSALLQHPDVTYGYPEYDFLEPLFAGGVKSSGHHVAIVSTNDILSDLEQIKAGTGQVADAGADRNYLGWASVDRLLRMILHKPPPTSVTVPVRVFDKTNINSIQLTQAAEFNGLWWAPITYRQQFLKLWGVG